MPSSILSLVGICFDYGMEHDNGDSFPVCETVSEAVDFILKHSFAIHRVDKDTANAISEAWQEGRRFFDSSQKSLFHRVVNGHLHGFHVPSDAKTLFRSFCGSLMQPWPSNQFQRASEQVADKLHKLLLDCHDEMERTKPSITEKDEESNFKRLKMTSSSLDIPSNALEADTCPLDYFLYHNKHNAINCSEHVDRGILICVCLTTVLGLEVLPRDSHTFTCPEIQTHNAKLYRERQACTDLVCIMAGDQLKYINPEATACVHRVRYELMQSRLSITYELRAKTT